jgi:alpha-ketoglutarate-dependent 2,4-dichlorophenoxyacetate dioxygenase
MPWTERKLTDRFGVVLAGKEIGRALSPIDTGALYDAIMRFGLVVIPAQMELSDDEIHAFAASLGSVMPTPSLSNVPKGKLLPISNLDEHGKIKPADDWYVRSNMANELWHVDLSFVRPRALISILYGRVVPPAGGNTEFCDLRLAYEALSPEDKGRLATLTGQHLISHSRRSYGFDALNEDELAKFPAIARPLVNLHEESGRHALLLASHICELSGYSAEESATMLRELTAQATVPENCYSHRWKAGDLLLWDNRCVMHRATPFDVVTHARDLRAVRLFDLSDASAR